MCSNKALCGRTETSENPQSKKHSINARKSVFKAKKTEQSRSWTGWGAAEVKLKPWGNLKCQYRHHYKIQGRRNKSDLGGIWALPDKNSWLLWVSKLGWGWNSYHLSTEWQQKSLLSAGWVTIHWSEGKTRGCINFTGGDSSIMSWDSTSKSTDIKYIHEDIFTKQNKNKVDRKQNTIRSNGSSREAKHKSVNGLQYRKVGGGG